MMTIPNYKILNQIYENANSLVYRGLRNEDNQPVILKVLKEDSPANLAHYQQEYEFTRSLNLAGVIKTYNLEKYQNTPVIIFEDFGGESLKQWMTILPKEQWGVVEWLPIFIQAADTLGQIHAANVIHKDINPSNIIWNKETGELKIIDFGISTILPREIPTFKNPEQLEGTLAYISPEQTGRMNRGIDYRTDFYALGVTFYELLTHHLPFEEAEDAMALVHRHLAKQPTPPHLLNPEIPEVISDIIIKLLEKPAEARYQSAWGLKADLEKCQARLAQGQLEAFTLGQQDISDKFQLPQKLYGRESDIKTLVAAFDKASQGPSSLMLVAGYAGIGKSALIQEIYKPITEKRGFFIAGKFNQFQRNTPYSAIVMAFQDLVQQLLTENNARLAEWKEKILAAVGTNGQVIAQVIPEIEIIIGTQPPLPALNPTAAQNRFNYVFQNFIQLFCQAEHPLVIFLDDLQWADSASLKLMTLIMAQSQHLFLIGAYRDNEVDATHPLMFTLSKISVDIKTITIAPLSLPHINQLIADALSNTLEESRDLADLVQTKTGGNPFFLGEFLKTLYIEELLNFDFREGRWQWDLAQIKARNITDNVVELMTDKVHKLSEKTQQALKLAACIGNQFEIETLAIVSEKDAQETKADLWEALADGLIFPLEKAYKFAHDRVQQAVYSLIPEEEKQVVHWQIGQLLLKNTPPEHREQSVFVIVDQLNAGIELIEQQSEREELAHLNRLAGEKARASAAYQHAFNYFSVALGLLSSDNNSWQTQYDLALALHVEAAEAAYLSGQFEQMEQLLEVVLQQAKTLLDKIKAYEIKISSYLAQDKMLDAIETALPVLAQLGVSLPQKPNKLHIILGLLQTKITLFGKRTEDLIDLPEMTDSAKLAAMQILSSTTSAAYMAVPELFPLLVFKQVNLSLKYGNTSLSAYAYATYGIILCGSVGDIEAGYQFGQLALTVLERFEAKELKAKVLQIVNNFIRHWKEHTQETLKPLLMAYQSGVESGDLEYAAYAVMNHPINSYVIGQELAIIDREITAKYSADVARQLQGAVSYVPGIYGQVVLNLMGQSDAPTCFSGERYDEQKMLQIYLKSNNITALGFLYCNKLTLCYLFQAYPQAVENAAMAEKYLEGVFAMVLVPIFHFYDSLARLAVFQDAQKPEQKRILKKVAANQKK
ncbi:MAG: serine/threonine-protein kinase PknK, partial [Pseudomonadota bacterium]